MKKILSKLHSTSEESSISQEIIKSLSALIAVVKHENQLLENGKIFDIGPLVEKKNNALQQFQAAQVRAESFVKQGGRFNQLNATHHKLYNMFAELKTLNEQNVISLCGQIDITNNMIELVQQKKKLNILSERCYTKAGTIATHRSSDKFSSNTNVNDRV